METALRRVAGLLGETHEVRILTTAERWGPMRQQLRALDEDETVVIVGMWTATRVLTTAPSLLRRSVGWEHSLTRARTHAGPRSRLRAELAARAYRRCRAVVCVSEVVAETLEREWGILSIVVPNLLDLEPRSPGSRRAAADGVPAREDSAPARLLAVGAARPVKNYDLLLRALAGVHTPWTLEVVGDGPLRPGLTDLARTLGIGDRVSWSGEVDDVPARLGRSDLLVHTAGSETFGYVLLEAAEHWVPVVALDAPVMDRLVPQLVPGLLAGPDATSVAAQVEAALEAQGWDFEGADERRRRIFDDAVVHAAWASLLDDGDGTPHD